ncbi:MAG: DegT/DnrJ/EryC1/StrS family aminotransferase [Magnetococcales bacterium]|nr:DegT/DnrJ/EryC1/StrS family aminotransferase [Magnetococcales bacterium]
MKVPFLDLRVTDPAQRQELLQALEAVMDHGRIILGPEVKRLESKIANRIGSKFTSGVNSGTDALILALRALEIGHGDEVITTPLSFIATANAITVNGAKPVFADILDDLTLDPNSIEPLINEKTKAIIPVHWAGKACQMDSIISVAKKHSLKVIEDCSQAFGSLTTNNRHVGSMGDIGCFSMNSMKSLASLGEAGMIATNNKEVWEKIDTLRYHGLINREVCNFVSHNGRLDTVQAAFIEKRLDRYESLLARRRDTAQFYHDELSGLVHTPKENPQCRDVFYTYTIQTDKRDELQLYMAEQGIESKVQHIPLMPDQPVYKGITRNNSNNARKLVQKVLCIPANEKVSNEQREYVAKIIKKFFKQS